MKLALVVRGPPGPRRRQDHLATMGRVTESGIVPARVRKQHKLHTAAAAAEPAKAAEPAS